jgi:hypothetical protein
MHILRICLKTAGCLIAVPLFGQTAGNVAAPLSTWAEIAARAPTNGSDRFALSQRPLWQSYYAGYTGWSPPPVSVPQDYLRNLSDKPTKPRFVLTGKVWPTQVGEASVCLWEDDKLAAASFSIDDNNAGEIPAWREISQRYGGLKITWNLITANIGGGMYPPHAAVAGNWPQWQGLINEGFRVESHSVSHAGDPVFEDGWPGPEWEAAESIRQIETALPGYKVKLFAPPGSAVAGFNISPNWRARVTPYFSAARGFSSVPINPANQTDYFDIRTTAAPSPFVGDQPPANATPYILSGQVKNIFDPTPGNKAYRGWVTFFTHSLGATGANLEGSTNKETAALATAFTFLNEHREDLWIGFLSDVALYGQERDTAALTTTSVTPTSITFSLTSQMDPARFDYPLTVKVRLPAGWSQIKAVQAGKIIATQVIQHEGAFYGLIKAVPNRGVVTLVSGTAPIPIEALSIRTHGQAGTFGVPLHVWIGPGDPATVLPVECRKGSEQTIMVRFDKAVSSVASTTILTGIGYLDQSSYLVGGDLAFVVTGVADAQVLKLSLRGIVAQDGGTLESATVGLRVLEGDVNGSGSVNVADAVVLGKASGQALTLSNFRCDLNASGAINVADAAIQHNHSGAQILP